MKVHRVHQNLVSNPLDDPSGEVFRQLDSLGLDVPQGEVAITAGSRGIDNLGVITKAAGDWLRSRGATPFLVPCMGSHNGATAEGQRQMVESLGLTESAMEMPIRSSMEVVSLGSVSSGEVWIDRHCYESAGVLVLNRVKLHTCFSGTLQSGLVKMMVVGMGKRGSAETFHSAPTVQMNNMLLEMGQLLVDSGKIFAGLALLEDGLDQTAEIHAVKPADILQREPDLLLRHRDYFPRLPIEKLRVLIVDQIGKTYSGTGMDTNVIGYRGVKHFEDLENPNIDIIAALSLADASKGNALGVGLADFITQHLRDQIDEHKTFINAFTTGDMQRAKIPATLADDQVLIETIGQRYGQQRWMFIPNTLRLDELYITSDLCDEVSANPICQVDPQPVELPFTAGRLQLAYASN